MLNRRRVFEAVLLMKPIWAIIMMLMLWIFMAWVAMAMMMMSTLLYDGMLKMQMMWVMKGQLAR